MTPPLDLDELVERFTLLPDELALLRNKTGATRLGFAMLLKHLIWKGQFPRGPSDLPDEAVEFVARQVKVPAADIAFYDWDGRQIKAHRRELRETLGWRPCSVADAEKLTDWLAEHVCTGERRADQVRLELLTRCRREQIEPPATHRIDAIVGSALHLGEQVLFSRVFMRPEPAVVDSILALVGSGTDEDDALEAAGEGAAGVLGQIKSAPGDVSLNSMLAEILKLDLARGLGLPPGMFAGISPKIVKGWRDRAFAESPSHLKAHPKPVKVTLLAALAYSRQREITDTLVELLISTVHRIKARAQKRVEQAFLREIRRVTGKENILLKMTEAALESPDETVHEVIYPAAGGVEVLLQLLLEYKAGGTTYQQSRRMEFRASYSGHYRRGLINLIQTLEFRSANDHQPVVRALELVKKYATSTAALYPLGERVTVEGAVRPDWHDLMYRQDSRGRQRLVRAFYECAVFESLREGLKTKDIWVTGADKWRNPDEDLPPDFAQRRAENYAALGKPLDPAQFIDLFKAELSSELAALRDILPRLPFLDIAERSGGAIKLTPLDALPEPRNLRRLKQAITKRWGTVPLIDMLKETVLRTGCLEQVTWPAARPSTARNSRSG